MRPIYQEDDFENESLNYTEFCDDYMIFITCRYEIEKPNISLDLFTFIFYTMYLKETENIKLKNN